MKKTILIVEDQKTDNALLVKMLKSEYEILPAKNGHEALTLLVEQGNSISCILLDILMPVMDGFEFMEHLMETEYHNTPIIVMTANESKETETKALNAGAWDYIRKPFEREIVQSRIHNVIMRSQTELLDKLKYASSHDHLTHLYNRKYMFQRTRQLLEKNPDILFSFVRFDIKRFHLINSFYGEEFGNQVLHFIADSISKLLEDKELCVYGRVDADVFCICLPRRTENIDSTVQEIKDYLAGFKRNVLLEPAIGIYIIEDCNISIETMYARASMAAQRCKSSFADDYAYYDNTMTDSLQKSQEILSEMHEALLEEQFQIYLQPKYSLKTCTPCGAEALVRWIHPKKGMISPEDFIPVFEQNGFINKVDYYVWEKVCQLLRSWLDDGKNPAPVSVNISRVDMYNPQIVSQIDELVRKYEIPIELFQLELTETAYMDNPELMKRNVDCLQQKGFTVLMDDFGSGYSSLNTLKDIPVDVLKIDLKFLQKSIEEGRSEKILASIIRMANWLALQVIVEGVETEEQKDFLLSVGCSYVQGFYFAKPMPVAEYESLIEKSRYSKEKIEREEKGKVLDAIWRKNPQTDLLFRSMSQPVAIYEVKEDFLTPLRVNESYTKTFDFERIDEELVLDCFTSTSEKERFWIALQEAYDTFNISACEITRCDIGMKKRRYRVETSYIGNNDSYRVFFSTFMDVTEQRKLERELSAYKELLKNHKYKKKILIVEDTAVGRAVLEQAFQEEYSLLSASDGKQALELFKEHQNELAVVLLDIEMPIMDGREFLRLRQEIADSEKVPIIIISSDNSEEEQRNMLKLGVNDYVTKPFIPEVMVRRVKNVLEYQYTFQLLLTEYNRDRSVSHEENL